MENLDDGFLQILNNISDAWNDLAFQREKSEESMRFVDVSGGQWEGFLEDQFAHRPKFELDLTSQAVNQFNGEWRKGRFMVKYRPYDTKASEQDANLMNSLFRTDFNNSNGIVCVDTAVDEMSKAGIGHVKLKTKYEYNDDPEDRRKRICFEPILASYSMVVWDPQSKEKDKSDAMWCGVITVYTSKAFEKAYPGKDGDSFFTPQQLNNIFNFNSMKSVYVCEYYELKKKTGTAFKYVRPQTGEERIIWKDELSEHLDELADNGFEKRAERSLTKQVCYKSILYGSGYLEEPKRIAGNMIPIIPVYGWRSYVSGQEYYYGLVEKKKDPQRALNMSYSNNIENAASSPKSMPIFTAEQVSGLEDRWSKQHLGKYNYGVINGYDEDGNELARGPIAILEPAQIDPNSQIVADQSSSYIQGQSGNDPADVINPDASGEAIKQAVNRVNLLTYVPMDNIRDMMRAIGTVYCAMAQEVYAEQRFITLMNEDGSDNMTLLKKYVPDPYDKTAFKVENDVSGKRFNVIVDTGPTYQNMRKEAANAMMEILGITPPESPYFQLMYSSLIDKVEVGGLDDLKRFNRRQMLINGYVEPQNEEEEALLAQIAQEQANSQQAPAQELLAAEAKRAEAEAIEKTESAKQKAADTAKKLAETEEINAKTERMRIENALVASKMQQGAMQQ